MLVFPKLFSYSLRQTGSPWIRLELGNYAIIMLSSFNKGTFWMTKTHSYHLYSFRPETEKPDSWHRYTQAPSSCHVICDSAQVNETKQNLLWRVSFPRHTACAVTLGPPPLTFPMGRERQSLHIKKLLCEKCVTEVSMLKTAKQGVANLSYDTRGSWLQDIDALLV